MRVRSRRNTPPAREVGGYSVRVSDVLDDPEWDDFLEGEPGSPYQQTSRWGQVVASTGWRPVRVVVSEAGRVVGGVQVLVRPLPFGGNVGRVSWGPALPQDQPELARLVIDEMLALGKTNHIRYMVAQPPPRCDWVSDELERRGFRLSPFNMDYTATVLVDLEPSLDALIAAMKRKTRQYVRQAVQKDGLTFRRGSAADLPLFNRLKDAHAARLGYGRRDKGYYDVLWRALAPTGQVEILLAEHEGEPVSALLAVPFGDTFYQLERPWSGEHGDLRPNDLIEWESFKLAKSGGYRFVDLGGIDRSYVEATLSGGEGPPPLQTWEVFKLSFGGELALVPQCYDYVFNPGLRFAYSAIPPRTMVRFADMVRRRSWGTGPT